MALGLNAGTIAGALDTETLTDILLYHVARGRRAAQSVVKAKSTNGIIHVIDAVLLP